MEKVRHKTFSLDGDTIQVKFRLDAEGNIWHGEYPDFAENPRHTPNGRPWINVTKDDCEYSTSEYGDCGGCKYLKKQDEPDLIGICMNDEMKINKENEEANVV